MKECTITISTLGESLQMMIETSSNDYISIVSTNIEILPDIVEFLINRNKIKKNEKLL